MVILSILVLCVASSTDASDQVLDLPEVVVQPSLIPGLLALIVHHRLGKAIFSLIPRTFRLTDLASYASVPWRSGSKDRHGQGSPFLRGFTGAASFGVPSSARHDDTVSSESRSMNPSVTVRWFAWCPMARSSSVVSPRRSDSCLGMGCPS